MVSTCDQSRTPNLALHLCLCLVAAGLQAVTANPFAAQVLDRELDVSTAADDQLFAVAAKVCGGSNVRLSKISTVLKLGELLERNIDSLPQDLRSSGPSCLNVLNDLQLVLTSGNSNGCGDDKLKLIEIFHSDHISSGHHRIPTSLKYFFVHYALDLSSMCKRNLINNFDWDIKRKFSDSDYDINGVSGSLNSMIARAQKVFGANDASGGFDDVSILWNSNGKAPGGSGFGDKEDEDLWKEIGGLSGVTLVEKSTGDVKKLFVLVKDNTQPKLIQDKCRKTFRPVYGKLISPILRLSSLGFAHTGEELREELEEMKVNPLVKRWYAITHLCETVLPIKYFVDDQLDSSEQCEVLDKKEAEQRMAAENQSASGNDDQKSSGDEVVDYQPTTNNVDGWDALSETEPQVLNRAVDLSSSLSSSSSVSRTFRKLLLLAKNLFGL